MTKTTLVIRHGAFGDLAKVVPFLWSTKKDTPQSETTLLTGSAYKDLILSLQIVNDVITDDRDQFCLKPSFFQKAHTLKQQINNFDEVIDLQSTSRTHLYKKLASKPNWKHIYKNKSPLIRQFQNAEETTSTDEIKTEKEECLKHLKQHIKYPEKILSLTRFQKDKPYLVFILDVSKEHRAKSWPLQYFIQLIELYSQSNLQVICCAQNEIDLPSFPYMFNLTGKTSLIELVEILAFSTLTIGGDTGPLHWSALFKRPTLSLFGSTSDVRVHTPTSNSAYILQAEELAEISPEKVFLKAQKIIAAESL